MTNLDEDVQVEIKEITGHDPRYEAWSVVADVCIQRENGPICERTVAMNVFKNNGNFETDGEGNPAIVEKISKKYENEIVEDPQYKAIGSQEIDEEKNQVKNLVGQEFNV